MEPPPALPATNASTRRRAIVIEPSSLMGSLSVHELENRGLGVVRHPDVVSTMASIVEQKPAVVVTAFELPGFCGNSLVAALKCDPNYRAIPICVIMSSESSINRFGQYHPDAILMKNPELQGQFSDFLDSIQLVKPKGDELVLSAKVLLVEDNRINQLVFSRRLHVAGAEVTVVENGEEALDAVDRMEFDLILMDIEMPQMDGRAATQELRRRGVTTPIAALTGHDTAEFREEADQIGFNDVIAKSVSQVDLIAACMFQLELSQA